MMRLAALATMVLCASRARAQSPQTFAELMTDLSSVPGIEARFREEKRIALLAAPLVNEGVIHFSRPDRFARHTRSPERSSVLIDGRQLVLGTSDERREVSLGENPVVRTFVDGFLGMMSGDRVAIERSYSVAFSATPESWQVILTPRDVAARRLIRAIRVSGRGTTLEQLVISEQNGDESDTRFTDTIVRHYSGEEVRQTFQLQPGA